jgi:DNA-binding NarL/FixJ family response regulator
MNADPYIEFTRAERRVADLLVEGYCVKDIAAARGICEGVVKAHLMRMYRKAGIERGSKAVRLAVMLTGLPAPQYVEHPRA